MSLLMVVPVIESMARMSYRQYYGYWDPLKDGHRIPCIGPLLGRLRNSLHRIHVLWACQKN